MTDYMVAEEGQGAIGSEGPAAGAFGPWSRTVVGKKEAVSHKPSAISQTVPSSSVTRRGVGFSEKQPGAGCEEAELGHHNGRSQPPDRRPFRIGALRQ